MSGRPRRRLGALLTAAAAPTAVLVPAASSAAATAHGHRPPPRAPRTVVIDGHRIQQAKLRLDRGDPALRTAVKALTAKADSWLGHGPWTVVDKPKPARRR
ncbi:hypothetical protein [Streptomyces sp. NBC_01320]|uniref:hypothetical protein n=1 Tax=Streptomyces sp. NBC_01320 TaxID=2903824 RepID=UPI002E11129F|nr:hypothetical protein OG395_41195 [Streptomyces sp. NBC_01320]